MFHRKANGLEKASQLLDQGTALIAAAGTEAVKNRSYYAKQLRRAYPHLADDVKNIARDAAHYAQAAAKNAGQQFGHLSHEAVPYARSAEKHLIRAGFVYAAYKLFMVDDERVYQTTHRMKACIKEKPVQSALVALGAGLLLGKIWR